MILFGQGVGSAFAADPTPSNAQYGRVAGGSAGGGQHVVGAGAGGSLPFTAPISLSTSEQGWVWSAPASPCGGRLGASAPSRTGSGDAGARSARASSRCVSSPGTRGAAVSGDCAARGGSLPTAMLMIRTCAGARPRWQAIAGRTTPLASTGVVYLVTRGCGSCLLLAMFLHLPKRMLPAFTRTIASDGIACLGPAASLRGPQ